MCPSTKESVMANKDNCIILLLLTAIVHLQRRKSKPVLITLVEDVYGMGKSFKLTMASSSNHQLVTVTLYAHHTKEMIQSESMQQIHGMESALNIYRYWREKRSKAIHMKFLNTCHVKVK